VQTGRNYFKLCDMHASLNLRSCCVAVALALTLLDAPKGFAQGTAFSYQGQLMNNGAPATGNFDITFTLFPTNQGGSAVTGSVTNFDTAVSGGLFLCRWILGKFSAAQIIGWKLRCAPAGTAVLQHWLRASSSTQSLTPSIRPMPATPRRLRQFRRAESSGRSSRRTCPRT
jgi:hypothetical protein